MKETWLDIKGYEGLYKVSFFGRVMSCKKVIGARLKGDSIMKPYIDSKGYLNVRLCKDSKYKNMRVNRLVAFAFIENPNNYDFVNHKDYNIKNNRVDNLEWVTAKMNSQWSLENNRKAMLKINNPISGHHYIQKRGVNSYRFQFNKNNKCIVRKAFKKLEDAIKYRDEWLRLNQPQIKLV